MSDQFQDILNTIKENKTYISAKTADGKTVSLSPLTLSQQKQIIETAGDPTLSILTFNKLFYNILKTNLVEENIDNYNTIDRVCFTLALRGHLSDKVELEDNSTISISDILERNDTLIKVIEDKTITAGEFVFECSAPTLEIDNKINELILKKYKKVSDENITTLIADLYVYEILKFIKTLSVGERQINFRDNYTKSLEILGNIDSKHLSQIADYINEVREAEALYSKIPEGDTNIDIVPNLFIL